jgi:hypothetical protein
MNNIRFAVALAVLSGISCAAPGAAVGAKVTAPVGISADHRYFVDGSGKPCFWLGDTEWELFTAFREDEAQLLLEDRAKKGFNAIQVMILGVSGTKKVNLAGQKAFLNDDPSTPNEGYFAFVDAIVKRAERLNLALVIGIYHKSPDYSKAITMKNARSWAAWVGHRYKDAPNVVWSMFPVANEASVPIVRELAAGLAEGDGGRHLTTVHPDPSPASSSWIHEEPWLSFNTLQSWKSDYSNYKMVEADYGRTPVKPVVNGEARYEEEDGTTPLMVRRGAWWSVLAGGFYSYGHAGNWMKPADWRRWVDSPGSRQMTLLRDVFGSLDWWTLVPDSSFLERRSGEVASARAFDRTWALLYFPSRGSVAVRMTDLREGLLPSWMNPATGQTLPAERATAKGVLHLNSPEGWEDAVLLIRAP